MWLTSVKISGLLVALMLIGMEIKPSLLQVPAMQETRAGHTATLLPDGQVLVTGGCVVDGCDGGVTPSAELYDPVRNMFSAASSLSVARVGHRAVMLTDKKVLILGGWTGVEATGMAERYDPETKQFEVVGEMLEPRDGFAATQLPDGRVLITGGYSGRMNRLSSAELYNPETDRFTALPAMQEARMSHTATLLADGRVLIVGGSSARGHVSATAEVFDPETQQFELVGRLTMPRHKHAAIVLESGDVLIVGGAGVGDWNEQYNSTELFDAATLSFRPAASMNSRRFKLPDAVTLLSNGEVLVAGGGARAEIYHPETDTFRVAPGALGFDLAYTTATSLQNERILIAGGYDERLHVVGNAWLYATN